MRSFFLMTTAVLCLLLHTEGAFSKEAAKKLTISNFIETADKDYRLLNHRELVQYLETAPGGTPYLDKVEFRTQTEDFDIKKQKYALRFYPKGWGETSAIDKLSEITRKSNLVEHEAYFNAAIKQRYKLIVDYLETTSHLQLSEAILTVYDDRINVLRKQSRNNISFDINDLITAEDEYTSLRLERVKLKNTMTGIVEKIKLAADSQTKIAFEENRRISINIAEGVIKNLQLNTNVENICLKNRKLKIERAENKYHLEKAKNRDFLSFFQVSYDTEDYTEPEKAYSVELGFKLPFINSDRESIKRSKINYLKEKLQYEDDKNAASEKIRSLSRAIKRLIRQHHILADRKENGNTEVSFNTYLKMEGINPINLLKIKESIIKNDIQLNRITYLILNRYIEILDLMGKLSEKPLKNYLSPETEGIS